MTTANRELQPGDSWMPAIAMLAIALLVIAALLNGIGTVGVMASASPDRGHHIAMPSLNPAQRLPFAKADRAIERLHLSGLGHPEEFEAYESLLLALAESLPATPDEVALARAGELLSRSLPAPAAEDVIAMLPSFLSYQQTEKALLGLSPGAPGDIEGAYLHLRLQDALRDTILGERIADQLYSVSYRMTETHMARQMLMQRKDLDEDEKRRLIREQMDALRLQENPEDAG
ncbi:hypothetical protein ACFOZ5_17275 [Marinobacter lacisalsi]|uniref:Lipase modulator n=1 Tax=Marinobacter lacisalsi TaxID=475979 RepID=A0ABV8QM62_9GAMM